MTLAHQIAERIHACVTTTCRRQRWNGPTTLHRHHRLLLAGMAEPAPYPDDHPRHRRGAGPATIWATDRKTSVLDATLVNGTASHALDYDDVSGVMGGHPSAMLIPSMIALGESLNSTGRDLALAYVVGYETECRIARGVHFHHYDKGWHPTATIGIFAPSPRHPAC